MKRLLMILGLFVPFAFGQGGGQFSGGGGGGSSLPPGVTGLASGANQIPSTPTAGTTYWLNDRSANYTQSAAVAISANNVNILCSPGVVIQFTGATDGFQISGTNDRIEGCTLDHNSQSGAGTGPLLNVTGLRFKADRIKIQNAGTTNPTTGVVYITTGGQDYLKGFDFVGTLADPGIRIKPLAATSIPDVTIDGAIVENFVPGTAAFSAINADDNASNASVPHLRIINSTVTAQGSNAVGIALNFDIPGRSPFADLSNDLVVVGGSGVSLQEGYHLFGVRYSHFDIKFDINSVANNFVSWAANFGDAFYNQIGGVIKGGAGMLTGAIQLIDYGHNVVNHLTIDGLSSSNSAIQSTTVGAGGNGFTVYGPDITINFLAGATNSNAFTFQTGGGFAASDDYVAGANISGDGTASQVGVKLSAASGARSKMHLGGLHLSNLGTGISIDAALTDTLIDPTNYFDGVTTPISDSGTRTLPQYVHLTAQTANIGATTAYAVQANGGGRYRACATAAITTAAGTSSTLPNVNVVYTDPDDSVVKTAQITATSTANTTGTASANCVYINAKASTNIQYSTTNYASNLAAAMNYNLSFTLYREMQ